MKKILSITLSIILIVMLCPLGMFTLTATAETDGLYTYTVSNGEATITKCNISSSADNYISLSIPSTLGGYPVTSIGSRAFLHRKWLTGITIPNTVTSIGDCAFEGCTGLTRVTIPNSVTRISYEAFRSCTGLTSITIPDSVTSIGGYAFYECAIKNLIIADGSKTITSKMVVCKSTLNSVTIPNSVTSIDSDAFYECYYLKKVDYISTISDWCNISFGNYYSNPLYYAENLYINDELISELIIPNTVTKINEYSLYNCTGLTSVTIGNSVTEIGDHAFYGCTGIESIAVNPGNTKYKSSGNCLINSASQALVLGCKNSIIPSDGSVTSIGDKAFYGCTGLTSITIPDSVTSIGNYAFYNCTGLTSVTIPDSVTSIGGSAFSGRSSLEEITLPFVGDKRHIPTDTYQYPFGYIFGNTSYTGGTATTQYYYGSSTSSTTNSTYYIPTSLKKVTITDSEYIPYGAFYKCSNLISITLPDSVTSIGGSTFSGCSGLKSITIPDSVISIGSNAFSGCTALNYNSLGKGRYLGNEQNPYFALISVDLSVFNDSFEIPSGVKIIYNNAFVDYYGLKSVIIPDSVKSIGDSAFDGCTGLTKVIYTGTLSDWCNISFSSDNSNPLYYAHNFYINDELITVLVIPDTVTKINDYAFYNCTALTSITIPDSVTSIGWSSFSGCTRLTKVNYIGTLSEWCNISFVNFDSNPLYYAKNLYIKDNLITDLVIPDTVAKINDYAFCACTGLKSIEIPDSVTSIGEGAFAACSEIKKVNYTGTIADWCNISFGYGSNPLCYDNNLYINDQLVTDIVIPNTVKEIKSYAFEECISLKSVTIPDSVTSIGNNAFYWCIGLTNVKIGNSVESIGDYVFYGCKKINNFTIPDSVITIGESAFYCCTGLTDITIPDLVTSIGEGAFAGCTGLKSVTIGNSVTSIGWSAFFDCKGLTKVTIPDSVTSIGGDVFSGCSSLQEITLPFVGDKRHTSSDTYQYPFGYIFGTTSYTGGTATTQYYYGSSTSSATNSTYYIPTSLKKVTITDSEYIPYDAFYKCSNLTSITVPDSVTSISEYTFRGCTGLTSITIPNSVTWIGKYAFSGCTGLTSITIPNSVRSIGHYAFDGCTGLKSITIPDSVTSMDTYAFNGCNNIENAIIQSKSGIYSISFSKKLKAVELGGNITEIRSSMFSNCTGLTSVTIGNSVTSIGDYAFSSCTGLKNVTIGDSVTSIGDYAFDGCTGLKDIWYGGSYNDRDNITVGTNNAPIISATWHFNTCKDGEHIFDSACDTTCNNCEWTRETTHTVVIDNAVAPTCTETGLTEGKHCSACGTVLVAQTEVPALGHNYKAVVTNPTCTVQGYTTHTCSRCHDSYVDTYTDALGHDYKAVVTKPTCTERGYTTYNCSHCHDSYVDNYTDALGHNWNNGVVTTKATCTVNGVKTYTCKHDNSHTYTEPINATGHSEVIDKAVKPTCTKKGLTEGKHCSVCNAVLTAQTVVPALGHTMVNGKCSVCGYQAAKVKFPDVSYSAWYGNSVAYAVSSGLMKGYANGKFGTSDGIQRQDFVVILARLSGDDIDSYAGKSSFKDVPTNAYYATALAWAKAKGVSNGYNDGSFGVGDKVTREQIMTFLYNYAKLKGYDTTVTDAEKAQIRAQYSDFVKVSSYAKEATYWALKNGVISGKQVNGKRYISPGSPAQRCEVAAMFYNINEKGIFA